MRFLKTLEFDDSSYQQTINTLIKNGLKVSEHNFGSRKTIYANNEVCGFNKVQHSLPLSNRITNHQLNSFLGAFTKNLYRQFAQNSNLFELKIEWNDMSRDKNLSAWKKVKSKEIFYNIDLSSAYWQIAYKLGYVNKKMFEKYMFLDEYKEAKRYCISFLARENKMKYFDGRKTDIVYCDTGVLYQVYENVRHELYKTICEIRNGCGSWIEYNIDGVSVSEKYLQRALKKFEELNLYYKINECFKVDSKSYVIKTQIRNF